jgi:hypothetical protein
MKKADADCASLWLLQGVGRVRNEVVYATFS